MSSKVDRCVNLLSNNLGTEVKWSGSFVRPMEYYENPDKDPDNRIGKHLTKKTYEIISYFGDIHGWIPANPSKEETVEALNNLYVEEKVDKYQSLITGKKRKGVYVNEFDKENNRFIIDNIIDSNDFIFFAGLKGVGKTTFLNWWLNNYSEKLADRGIIWFRVDASKLYRLWDEYSSEKCDLFRYYKVHLIYVVLKYAMKSENYKQNETFEKIVTKINKSIEALSYVEAIQKIIIESPASEKETEIFFNKIFSKSMTSESINPGGNTLLKKCEKLYDEVETYFVDNNLTMLFIIDGVDNISWTKSKKNYNKLLEEIIRFFSGIIEVPIDCKMKRLVTLRHETIADIDRCRPHDSHSSKSNQPFICEIRPPRIKSILLKKANVAKNPSSRKFKKKKDDLIEKIAEDSDYSRSKKAVTNVLSDYTTYSINYIDSIQSTIKKRYQYVTRYMIKNSIKRQLQLSPDNWNNPDEMLSILFNSNVRACVDNFIENYKTITLARKQSVLGADESRRLPIYLLTNGRLFLNTPHQTSRLKGNAYPNLFWWDENLTLDSPFAWHGLCTIRLLQFSSRNRVIASTLKEVVGELFDYNESVIQSSFDRCVQYGLFIITRSKNEEEHSDYINDKSHVVTISDKGKFMLDYIFMYPDWLYISAIDTPLDKNCVENSKQIAIHRDIELNFLETYNAAFVITIPTFTRHILTQHDKDLKNIKNNVSKYLSKRKNTIQCFLDENDAINTFKIPCHIFFILKQAIHFFLYKLKKREPRAFTDLHNIILGEYQKNEYQQ